MADSTPAKPTPKPRLRWYQFRLRSLLLFTTLILVALGVFVVPPVASYHRQKRTIELIEKLGGRYEARSAPAWLCRLAFEDFWDVTLVSLADCDDPDAYVDQIVALPRLEMLAVGGERFTDRHLERLGDIKTLRGLVLDWTAVSPEAVDALKRRLPDIDVYPSAHRLCRTMLAPQKTHHGLYRALGIVADQDSDHPELRRRLEAFFGYPFGLEIIAEAADGDAPLERLWQLTKVQNVKLTAPGATAAGLANLSRLRDPKRLSLNDTPITDDGLAHLPPLTEFYLSAPHQITEAGIAHLKSMTQLSVLGLQGKGISVSGLRALETLPLQMLFLTDTNLTDESLASVAKIASLLHLHLDGTAITDHGLAQLQALPKLQGLSLLRTAISDAGIAPLKELRGLQWLQLVETSVTDRGIQQLREALPNCRITTER